MARGESVVSRFWLMLMRLLFEVDIVIRDENVLIQHGQSRCHEIVCCLRIYYGGVEAYMTCQAVNKRALLRICRHGMSSTFAPCLRLEPRVL